MVNPLKDKVTSLQDRSAKVLDVFTKTIEGLQKIAEESVAQRAKVQEKIAKLEEEKDALVDLEIKNENLVSKLKGLIS